MPAPGHVDPARTVVKVRGKTGGQSIERTRTRPRRSAALRKRPASQSFDSHPASDYRSSTPRSKKQKRSSFSETPLESLPPEILHLIFEYSRNLDLPLASRQLALVLSESQHLQSQLTDEALLAVVGEAGCNATLAQFMQATRLLNSKFVTWDFFTHWLCRNTAGVTVLQDSDAQLVQRWEMAKRWLSLRPSSRLMPPKKLLCGPFTPTKLSFLNVLAQGIHDLANSDPLLGEIAREGLMEAVLTGNVDAVVAMLGMGLQTSTELLRAAVIEGGCDRSVVRILLTRSGVRRDSDPEEALPPTDDVDLHDPAIWAWAATNSDPGDWLKSLLLNSQRIKERVQAFKSRNGPRSDMDRV